MNPKTTERPSASSQQRPSTSFPSHRPGQAAQGPSTSSGQSTTKINILVVDDKEQVRQDLKTVLGLVEGLEVVGEAADGLEALHQAEKLSPDVVLMDLQMPRMDGFEATRQIKDRCLARGIVALTVYGDDSTRERADRAGADAFVEKGTSLQTVSEIIRKVWSQVTSPGSD